MQNSEKSSPKIWLGIMVLCLLVTPFIYGNLQTFGINDVMVMGQLFIWTIAFLSALVLYIQSNYTIEILSKTLTLISSIIYSCSIFILFSVRDLQVDWNQLSPRDALLISFFAVLNLGAFAYLFVVFVYSNRNKKNFLNSLDECRKLYGLKTWDMVDIYLPIHKKVKWPLLIIAIFFI